MRLATSRCFGIACMLGLSGCYTAGAAIERGEFQDLTARPADSKVRVATPEDGADGKLRYPGSGRLVAEAVRNAVLSTFADVQVIGLSDRTLCEKRCAEDDAHLLIIPEIVRWEDHATNWSGTADKLRVSVSLFDLAESKLRRITFTAHSTWWNVTDDPPEYMLDDVFRAGVASLLPSVIRSPSP